MTANDLTRLMWSDALSLLDRAERLQRQFIRPAATRRPAWEPPVDVVETAQTLRVTVALPGVEPGSIAVAMEPEAITVTAHRAFAVSAVDNAHSARIHSLEIPHGRFERRIGLPMRTLSLVKQNLQDGCLSLIFGKKESA